MNSLTLSLPGFDQMFAHLTVPAMLVAENGTVQGLNDAAAALFCMEENEVRGKLWAGLDAHLTAIQWRSRWKELQTAKKLTYATDILTGHEYLRSVNVTLALLEPSHTLIILQDRIASSMIESELEMMADKLQAGFWSYNRVDGRIRISQHARRLLGLPDGEPTKQNVLLWLSQHIPTSQWEEIRAMGQRLLREPLQVNHSFFLEKEGGLGRVKVSANSVGNSLHITHLYGIIQEDRNEADNPSGHNISGDLAIFSIEHAQDMIFWTRPDGSIFYINQIVSNKLGIPKEKLIKMKVKEYAPYFDGQVLETFWQRLRTEKYFEAEYPLYRSDGQIIDVYASISYLRFGEEEFSCGICRDITTRRKLEQRQKLTEFTIDNSEEMILWSTPESAITYANDTFFSMTGYQLQDLSSLSPQSLFPVLVNPDQEVLWNQLRKEHHLSFENNLRLAKGKLIPVRLDMNYLQFEGGEFACIYLRDLRGKKKRDRQIKLSQVALDTALDYILWLDEKFRIRYVNNALLQLLGSHPKTWVGTAVEEAIPGLHRTSIAPGETLDVAIIPHKGTEEIHLNLQCSEVVYEEESIFMLVGRDLTALVELQEDLKLENLKISELRDRLLEENTTLREDYGKDYNINEIITVSPKYQAILKQVGQVADVDTTVLITGETGTGKELLARAIHQLSDREEHPLVKVNCAALPESLIESELFGHEKGAFTGATARKKGRFEMADKGTIFLDEIGELPLELQSKLLRVLQEDEFERVGGTETIRVDVRLVAATNRDLAEMVREGRFREDLYYRLNVFPIVNLPLRERPEDIPVLVEHFTHKFAKRQGKTIRRVNTADLNLLKNYAFPGNIRELENLVERAVVLCQSDTLSIKIGQGAGAATTRQQRFLSFEEMQRQHIIDALKRTGGRVTGPDGAGILLDMNDRTLVSKMRKLRIEKHEYLL
ncbi:sigma 54-interacting transcriptional regulator [Neolewinella lacunae]|uniref:Sigma 54-interacting transcriptional regulator n=1 Tax=Neolewinella lacunae TaxID=1517758 RepID=A0A923PMC6_9BACT|nr:sigma 54-interacting transcriptional regulator [Neolewinella lacunae]MBC6996803.1 sigma 54-interacting transcriptional regulator [Neolewinella lacunae]MDN3637031.1 sigma 54-interacting transcriptional regulator [Neolewinella lacunae]